MKLSELLDGFRGVKALVIGDLMLDEYVFGRATRISPEAPVMVVKHQRTTRVPGGAANVARNIIALGGSAKAIGVAGNDEAGDLLEKSFHDHGFTDVLLLRDPARSTTRKTRVLADHTHQVLRIDQEDDVPISGEISDQLLKSAEAAVAEVDVVVLSDYMKGVLTERLAKAIIERARSLGKIVVANPKPRTLPWYEGANLVSLNRAEASEALNLHHDITVKEAVASAEELRSKTNCDAVLLTLGEGGMVAAGGETLAIAAPKVEVYDTAGAGDTVIATVALGLSTSGFRKEVFELAAQTAGSVVRHVGVAVPSEADLNAIRALD